MFDALRNWRRRRVLARRSIPETLWREALERLPFLAMYTEDEQARLRELCVLFLDEKGVWAPAGTRSRRFSA